MKNRIYSVYGPDFYGERFVGESLSAPYACQNRWLTEYDQKATLNILE